MQKKFYMIIKTRKHTGYENYNHKQIDSLIVFNNAFWFEKAIYTDDNNVGTQHF
jgi:hypothetical protein